MALDDSRFAELADRTMERLMDAIEGACGNVEVELQGGILTVDLLDGGKFLLNKHAPLRQLWLSSPKSGAWHFDFDEQGQVWRSTRGTETLQQVLSRDLSEATGAKVAVN